MKLLKLILILFICRSMVGCLASKTISDSKTETKESFTKTQKKDSVVNTQINGAIDTQTIIDVAQTGNEELDKRFDEVLSKLNQQSTSGGNGYKLYYDPELKQLLLDIKVAQTENSSIATNNDTKESKSFEQQTDEYIEKKLKVVPWYLWVVLGLYFLPKILAGVSAITNPLGTLVNKFSNFKLK